MQYLTQSQYARKHGVSRQRVNWLIKNKRIPCFDYKNGVIMIDAKTPYPRKKNIGRPCNSKSG